MKISVAIVESCAEVRESLVRLVNGSPGLRCVGEHTSGEEMLAMVLHTQPNVILIDIKLSGKAEVDCIRRLKSLAPMTEIIVLTVYQQNAQIFDALKAGATGYLLKQTPPDELLAAIKNVHEGGAPMSGAIARKVVQYFYHPQIAGLSPREAEVLDYLSRGYQYKEISEMLGLGFSTVRSHVRRIYEKLQVRSRTEATVRRLESREMATTSTSGNLIRNQKSKGLEPAVSAG